MASDGGMSNTSEFDPNEKMYKFNILQLPLFEINNTLQALIFKKHIKENEPAPSHSKVPNNSLSRPMQKLDRKSVV